ncbi:hypothetical protein MPSEU_000093900 [Mayamaea pseudoterrestris]|nr:hypothetical protein MPSEU_000093900 [Mayamaea pseudoterrestris]
MLTILSSSVALTRLEASIMGESALIDREDGRVLWESGGSTVGRLSASVAPKLDELGVAHVKAKILTCILVVGLSGYIVRSVQSSIQGNQMADKISRIQYIGPILVTIAKLTVFRIPKSHPWLLFVVWVIYMIESYTSSTRYYLSHKICTPDDIELHLEQLRSEIPVVTWQVRCFHYEGYSLPRLSQIFAIARRRDKNDATGDESETFIAGNSYFSRLRRKVVTSKATGLYQIKHWQDKTVAGVWKRAPFFTDASAPLIKLVLSKLLVLSDSKTRQEYMKQQSNFVSKHGQGDEFAEFSTSIHVPGFRRRLLAVRPDATTRGSRMFRPVVFWIATLLLLTVPYRIWFSNYCDEVRVTILKETFVTPIRRANSSQRGWLSSFYPDTNLSIISAEDENFRAVMRQIRLYRSTCMDEMNATNINPLIVDAHVTNSTVADVIDADVVDTENVTKVDDAV